MDADCVDVVQVQNNFKSLTAKTNINKGTFLGDFRGKVIKERNRYTVQIGLDSHIDSEGHIIYANHSCSPNAQMVYHARKNVINIKNDHKLSWHMIASRDIAKGEPITFDYTLTEYSMAEPFDCLCKSQNCLGRVQGFKFLSKEDKEKRLPVASPVVQQLCKTENK